MLEVGRYLVLVGTLDMYLPTYLGYPRQHTPSSHLTTKLSYHVFFFLTYVSIPFTLHLFFPLYPIPRVL
ncbi:hypothetical protein BGZ63DRAFT_391623 [Mariannaea sp. PMI_226]|nr:hypothetical protein BGZ63DRAFT_391623 [Mariannaea sp. PMI_226]